MNSTDPTKTQGKETRTLFEERLLPLAARLRDEGRNFFALGPDASATTYYIRRQKTSMTRKDFEGPQCATPETLARSLETMWAKQGYDEFSEAAAEIAALAFSLRTPDEQDSELSELIYVMY